MIRESESNRSNAKREEAKLSKKKISVQNEKEEDGIKRHVWIDWIREGEIEMCRKTDRNMSAPSIDWKLCIKYITFKVDVQVV